MERAMTTLLITIGAVLASGLAFFLGKLAKRPIKNYPLELPKAQAKEVQKTLDKQTIPVVPKSLPVPPTLTRKELEALADEEDD